MPRSIPPGWLRLFLRYALWLIPAWVLASFLADLLVFFPGNPDATLASQLMRSAAVGVGGGLLGALVASWILLRFARRFPFGVALVVRPIVYAGVVALAFLGAVFFVAQGQLDVRARDVLESEVFASFVGTSEFAWFCGLLLGASFLITLGFQINRVLGPGTLRAHLPGRYVRPVEEERVFLFLDHFTLPEDLHAEAVGSVPLRGKENPVQLFSVERSNPLS